MEGKSMSAARRVKTLFGYQNKDAEGGIVLYYAKYIGLLSSNKSYPLEEDAYVHFYEDRVVVDLLKSKVKTVIPYKNMTDIQNVDAGKKVDLDRVFGLSLVSSGIGSVVSLVEKTCDNYSCKIF
jgi:hypothetical protein